MVALTFDGGGNADGASSAIIKKSTDGGASLAVKTRGVRLTRTAFDSDGRIHVVSQEHREQLLMHPSLRCHLSPGIVVLLAAAEVA